MKNLRKRVVPLLQLVPYTSSSPISVAGPALLLQDIVAESFTVDIKEQQTSSLQQHYLRPMTPVPFSTHSNSSKMLARAALTFSAWRLDSRTCFSSFSGFGSARLHSKQALFSRSTKPRSWLASHTSTAVGSGGNSLIFSASTASTSGSLRVT